MKYTLNLNFNLVTTTILSQTQQTVVQKWEIKFDVHPKYEAIKNQQEMQV